MELLFTFSHRNRIIRSVFQFIWGNILGDATKNKTGGYFLPSCAVPIFFRSTIGLAPVPLKSQILSDDATGFIGRDAFEIARHRTGQQS